MSHRIKSVFVCLLLAGACLCFQAWRGEPAQRPIAPAASAATLQGEAAIQQLKSDGGYASLAAAMSAARYQINAAPANSAAPFYADNSGQRLRATFAPDEVRVNAAPNQTSGKSGGAELRLQLAGYGYGDQLESLAAGKLAAQGDRITITKSAIIHSQGPQSAIPLRVAMSIGDGWCASLRGDQQGAFFERQADGLRLSYDHLAAYDARGRALPARMALDGDKLALLVDDAQAIYPLTIDPIFRQQRKLAADDGAVEDIFGGSVALSGNTAVIGALGDDNGANSNQGSVYVFVRSGSSWSLQQKLTAGDGAAGDEFGASVALIGDTVVVGAPFGDIGANADKGSAYIFTRSGTVWSPQQKLTANDGAVGDEFGIAVALSGNTVVVGARGDGIGANMGQGSAYVFIRSGTGWSPQQKLTASDGAASDRFGNSVALSGDTVVVGAKRDDIGANEDQGSAYVFTRSGAVWSPQQKLTAGDGAARDEFGDSVALSGDTVVVGAPDDDVGANSNQGSVYVFTRSGAAWSPQRKLTASDGASFDDFGRSVALSGDTLVVGAPEWGTALNQGSAYVFARSGGGWSQQRNLFAEAGAANGQFGGSVALSGDTVVVGAPLDDNGVVARSGAAYVFVIGENSYVQQQSITAPDGMAGDHFGHAVAVSGDTVVVGVPEDDDFSVNQGSAYVFIRSGSSWMFQQALVSMLPGANDAFGFSVAISGDTIVVGATKDNGDKGAVYIFTRNGNTWRQQQRLTASDNVRDDLFGCSVAISGNTVAVGAQGRSGSGLFGGKAYIFTRSGVTWTEQARLLPNDSAVGALFGHAVAVSGNTVVVGAPLARIVANENQGAAYVFTRSGATWNQQQKLSINDGAAGDAFGSSVALSGDTLVVGAPFDDIGTKADQGSAYVFASRSNGWTLQSQQLIANDGASGDDFGFSVAISGETVVVGALLDDIGANIDQGSAYVFNRLNTLWTQKKLTANGGAAGDVFGCAVALSGDTVVVGALFDTVDSNSAQGSASVFVNPACPAVTINPASLPGARIGASYNQTVTASSIGGGAGPYQFSLSGGALPPGLTLAQNGQIAGAPTTAGTYSFTITATIPDSLCPGSRSYTLTVSTGSCPVVTLNPASLPEGQRGAAYSQQLGASGGATPYSFSLTEGALPAGLSLSNTGLLNGAPTQAGAYNFSVTVADANTCPGTRAYTLTIRAPGCSYAVAPIYHAFTSEGGAGAVNVNAGDGCAWTAASDAPWITIASGSPGSGNGTLRFAVAKNQDTAARKGTLNVAGRKVTVVQAPAIACVSAASFVRGALATESIVAAFGEGLAQSTEAATSQPLPTTLADTRVSVMDSLGTERFAPLFFVSPTQINFQVPDGAAAGNVLVTVTRRDVTVAAGSPRIEMVSPGLFSANSSGQGLMIGVALRVKADGSQSFEPIARFDQETQQFVAAPIDLGPATDRVFLILFATGARHRSSLGAVGVKIGGVNTDALYAGPQGSFVGLDQLNVALPRSLTGRGEVEVAVMVDGKESNALKVAIK